MKIDIARKPIDFARCDQREEIFAPSQKLLMLYLNNNIDWEEYTNIYTDEMRKAYINNKGTFIYYAQMLPKIEFVCWCKKNKPKSMECHRFVLYNILNKIRQDILELPDASITSD